MTITAIAGARILADGIWHDDHAVLICEGKIASIIAAADIPAAAMLHALDGGMLVPGFIDTQVNGGGGVLFNDQPNVAGISAIADAHRRFGTTAMLPTLISDDLDVIASAIAAVDDAITSGVPGIVGIHIEGPFLNQGKRGIHDAGKFGILDAEAIALLSSLQYGKTLVTLAPELAPKGAIAALVENGVIVAAGHTLASYDDMQRAMAEGLRGVTHLFNAMTQLESRAPGVVGAALDSDLICGIIVDGHHVHPASLRAAYKARGGDGLMLVTDAMPTVGSTEKNFRLGDTDIVWDNGMLRSASGTLAGSDLDMASAVRNCVDMMDVDLSTACQMASRTPAVFLGLPDSYGRLAPGYRADMVHLDDALQVRATWIKGQMLQTQ
jgi:N-acetylglucosamine-6-phosphate deacetylase